MPEISRFLGIIITMHYSDHSPAHFHASYGEHQVKIGIRTLRALSGRFPSRAMGLVIEWASLHQAELEANWERARRSQPLRSISPLD